MNNENDGVNSLVHELAFGIDICFGSESVLYIDAILYIAVSMPVPRSQYSGSPTTLPA